MCSPILHVALYWMCAHIISLVCQLNSCCIVRASMLQLEGKLTLLHQHLNDLVDLGLVMMKALDEINTDSFQSFKLRIGEWVCAQRGPY